MPVYFSLLSITRTLLHTVTFLVYVYVLSNQFALIILWDILVAQSCCCLPSGHYNPHIIYLNQSRTLMIFYWRHASETRATPSHISNKNSPLWCQAPPFSIIYDSFACKRARYTTSIISKRMLSDWGGKILGKPQSFNYKTSPWTIQFMFW